jgi:hypothetical protein
MSLSSVLVIGNALRLRAARLWPVRSVSDLTKVAVVNAPISPSAA